MKKYDPYRVPGLEVIGRRPILLPLSTTAERGTGTPGMMVFNEEENRFEGRDNFGWGALGSGGAALKTWNIINGSTQLAKGNGVLIDTTGLSTEPVIKLPPDPQPGELAGFGDYRGTFGVRGAILDPNGQKFMGQTENLTLSSSNMVAIVRYFDATVGWKLIYGVGIGIGSGDETGMGIDLQPIQYGDGETTVFDAPHTIVVNANAFLVDVDGTIQTPYEHYTVEEAGKIRFFTPPEVGADIVIRYFRSRKNTPDGDISETVVRVSGGTTYRSLDERFNDVVNVRDHGAIGDGVADDTEAFRKACALAAVLGHTVKASGTFKIAASSNPIVVDSNVDFSEAHFICTTQDPKTNWSRDYSIFSASQSVIDITGETNPAVLTKGAMRFVGMENYEGWVSLRSKRIAMRRLNDGVFSSVNQEEPLQLVGNEGRLSAPLYFDFTAVPDLSVKYKPVKEPITIKAGSFDLSQANIHSPWRVSRNNTCVENLHLDVGSNYTASYTALDLSDAANITVDGLTCGALGGLTNQELGYLVLMTHTVNVRMRNVRQRNGWSGINGNYFRGFHMEDFDVFSFGCHAYGGDITIENGTFYRDAQIQGYGYFNVFNCHHVVNPNSTTTTAFTVAIRSDYGASWDGTVTIRQLLVTLSDRITSYRVTRCDIAENLDPNYPNVEKFYMPEISIDGVEIDGNPASHVDLYGFYSYGSGRNAHLTNKVMPTYIEQRNVHVKLKTSFIYYPLFNDWNMLDSETHRPLLKSGTLRLHVENIYARPLDDVIGDPFKATNYTIYTFPVPQDLKLKQVLTVDNANHMGLQPRTTANFEGHFRDCDFAPIRRADSRSGDVIVDDGESFIEFNNCRLIHAHPNVSGVLRYYVKNCVFDWTSYFGIVPKAASKTIHSFFLSDTVLMVGSTVTNPRYAEHESLGSTHELLLTYFNAPGGYFKPGEFQYYPGQVRTIDGTPEGTLTPTYSGEEVLDTTNATWYKSTGTTSADWKAITVVGV